MKTEILEGRYETENDATKAAVQQLCIPVLFSTPGGDVGDCYPDNWFLEESGKLVAITGEWSTEIRQAAHAKIVACGPCYSRPYRIEVTE